MIRVRPTVVRSTILILHVLGPGVQLALTVSNNDSVAFLKSLAAANLWQRMSHPGLASPDDLANYSMLDIGPTFVHPNYRHNPLNGDVSASYNKPASVMHWVRTHSRVCSAL